MFTKRPLFYCDATASKNFDPLARRHPCIQDVRSEKFARGWCHDWTSEFASLLGFGTIPCSPQNPKFLVCDDPEVV